MARPGISIESIAAWYPEAARNRRQQKRRRRGRYHHKEGRDPRETEQRDMLGSGSPARRSGDTMDVESVHEPSAA